MLTIDLDAPAHNNGTGITRSQTNMLILTRRHSQSVMIGEDIKVTVLGAKGHHVRIGIEAPDDIPVNREEVYQRLHQDDAGSESTND